MTDLRHSLILWHIALPLVGAFLLPLARRGEVRQLRTFILANVSGSVLLGALMVGTYFSKDSQAAIVAGRPPMSFRLTWLSWVHERRPASADKADLDTERPPSPDLSLSLGVDGVSLWFLAAIPLLVLCILLADGAAETWNERPLPVAALLMAESAALTVFAARDVVLLSAAIGALAFANSVAVGSRGQPGIRVAARALLWQQLAATALISISLIGAVVACAHMVGAPHAPPGPPVFDLDALVLEVQRLTLVSPPAQLVWRQLAPWLFLGLLVGCGLWSGAFPFHLSPCTALRNSGPAGRALLGGVTLKVGVYVLIRVALPLFSETLASLAPFLLLWFILSALYCAISLNGARMDAAHLAGPSERSWTADGDATLAEGAVVIVLLSMCGVLSLTVVGIVGAVVLLLAHAVCWMLHALGSSGTGGHLQFEPQQQRGQQVLVMLSLVGIPGLALFPGLLLTLLGISASPATAGSWLAMLLLYWLVLVISGWAHLEQARAAPGRHSTTDARIAMALLTAAILLIGFAPVIFTRPIQQSVLIILGQRSM